ncbi:hypothetical protein [Klebsiella michiganensis]|uniref:hypothetical protein n=1 Tax=Klebsiella michiganensis TaxID=1134687 RepID=UPI000C9C816A|nr:hypothetical protein [Klebsiella michiganensis]ELS4493833.1 hypothetical protein [Klebsiella michiganensis]ELS4626553.1 hypothetical protein [Klebsiella michiganensis]MBL6031587.1 hypothetical protein [Klebsiella michiganensis]MCK2102505.1 hypothetical protein [Klebsiella michiganensis]MDQ4328494.1 hypothetical protein [Klebsiella michiganensis]
MKSAFIIFICNVIIFPRVCLATPEVKEPDSALVLYGHSFLSNKNFTMALSKETKLKVYNFARGGSSSQEAAFISGGEPGFFSPVGGIIPADSSVELTPYGVMSEDGALWPGFYAAVIYVGVKGVLSSKKVNGKIRFFFIREEPGEDIPVKKISQAFPVKETRVNSGTEVQGAKLQNNTKKIYILWAGRNTAGGNAGFIIRDIKSIASTIKVGDHFIVMPEFPYTKEVNGSPGRLNLNKVNEEIKNSFPNNYCLVNGLDALQNFSAHYNKNNPQDLKDISEGLTPTTLRMDNLHPSDRVKKGAMLSGVEVNAKFIADCLRGKGWLK